MLLRPRKQPAIDVADAQARAAAGELLLVDVREPDERADGHPPGSLHIPLGELKGRLAELPADRPLAFVCRSGRRSAMAAAAARKAGLRAANVDGGMIAWERHGLDTEKRT